jgi:MoaA/NifB/PqqE/SkfB family radical SAM enzyme
MKTRKLPDSNYSSIFINGKTLRIPLEARKAITELAWPEFYDISPGNKCATGKCTFCYAAASRTGKHYTNLAEKVHSFFGQMNENQRPLQVAIGGEQEPLENPEIWEMIDAFNALGIVANYTTNGVLVNDEVIRKTKEKCGGVAVTLHPHLEKHWRRALKLFADAGIKVNVHVIVSDKASVDFTEQLYKEYADSEMVEYFVLLPYMNYGHASSNPKTIDYDSFKLWVDKIYKEGKLAFGANFYNFLTKHNTQFKVPLYSPEIFSKYLILDDDMRVCNNSFEKVPVNFNHSSGCEIGKVRTEFLAAA